MCSVTVNFAPPTAESVYAYLVAKGLPMTGLIAYNASTDPNHLLGRPTGYLSKCAWQDTRIDQSDQSSDPGGVEWGGSLEVFGTAGQATERAASLYGSALTGSGTFTPDTAV
jgi:hypothetical protein